MEESRENKIPNNCMDCTFHKVLPDPDPHDWFNDDDEKVVCTKTIDDVKGEKKEITVACRPYNKRKECERPAWCPLIIKQEKQ